jgi:hypothetical protein
LRWWSWMRTGRTTIPTNAIVSPDRVFLIGRERSIALTALSRLPLFAWPDGSSEAHA